MSKRKKKRLAPWDSANTAALEYICGYIASNDPGAIGIDPGWRGIGVAVCDLKTGQLAAAAALPLPQDDPSACREIVHLLDGVELFIAIERQPGVAKRKVVRVEGWLYGAAVASGNRVVYVQPRRKTDPALGMAGDDEIVELIKPAALREHARSALWCVRRALQQL